MKPKAILVDLDNTLVTSRVKATPDMVHWKDYWPLYEHIPEDEPQEWCEYIIKIFDDWNYLDGELIDNPIRIIFLTARPEHTRQQTVDWLLNKVYIMAEDYKLIMMPDDYPTEKSVTDYKREQVKKLQKKYDILFGIDDNENVCKMLEQEGIKALFCNVGTGNEK